MISSFSLYILPELSEHVNHDKYPIAFLIIVISYSTLLFLDKVLINAHHSHAESDTSDNDDFNNKNEETALINVKGEKRPMLTAILLTIMISFHSIIESVLIGIQSDASGTLAITLTIMAHKWVESLSLGILMTRKNIKGWRFFVILIAFSLTSPLGITIGTLIKGNLSSFWSSFFSSIAAGTFLYIGLNEIIIEEFSKKCGKRKRLIRFAFFIIGISAVGILRIWLNHEH